MLSNDYTINTCVNIPYFAPIFYTTDQIPPAVFTTSVQFVAHFTTLSPENATLAYSTELSEALNSWVT